MPGSVIVPWLNWAAEVLLAHIAPTILVPVAQLMLQDEVVLPVTVGPVQV